MKNMVNRPIIFVVGLLLLTVLCLIGCYDSNLDQNNGLPLSEPPHNEPNPSSQNEPSVDKLPVNIHVIKEPNKTRYYMYESLDPDGIKVIAVFDDNSEEEIDKANLSYNGFDSTVTGKQNITVTYKGKNDTFSVTILIGNFTVTFNKNGGNSEASPDTKTVAQPAHGVDALPAPSAKTNYDFVEWNTKADGSGDSFTAESLVTGNFTVYAQYKIKTYSVTFNSNGGSAVTTQTINHGEKAIEPTKPVINNAYNCKFDGWYTDNTTFVNKWNFNNDTVTENKVLYVKYIPYELGDTGPGGGKIFYRIQAGFPLIGTSETCYYLEVSPEDYLDRCEWSSTNAIAYTGPGIGWGKQNTYNLVSKLNKLGILDYYAAQVCDNYTTNNGFDDWFLPSKDELNQLYINRNYVGNLTSIPTNIAYWSSTQNTSDTINTAYIQYFTGDGNQPSAYLYDGFYVRAVRAF